MAGPMKSIAVYSLKGGVGKTTIALNLAWASAILSRRRTLLWDLDPQGATSFLADPNAETGNQAQAVFSREVAPSKLVRPTSIDRLDLLPADASLRSVDRLLFTMGKKHRLEKLLERLGRDHERIILDCPPGLTETSEQVLHAADLIIVPVIPAPLSQRALAEVVAYLDSEGLRRGALLPVFNMADRRRTIHRAALAENADWPVVPMASAVEAMTKRHQPLGEFAPRSPAAEALASLWHAIERRLKRASKSN